MAKIFVSNDDAPNRRWEPLEETDVAKFLGNPVMTGEVYLHNPGEPILEEVTDRTSHDQYCQYFNGIHIATNYGLSIFFCRGTTHIVPPERKNKGYSIIQLADIVVDYDKFSSKSQRPDLTANPMKMADAGRIYRIDWTFEEVMAELKKKYKFVGPEEGEGPYSWLMKMREKVQRQRADKITDEFVEYANKNYFAKFVPGYPTTKEDMVEHFSSFGL